jgi:hypothetical protein
MGNAQYRGGANRLERASVFRHHDKVEVRRVTGDMQGSNLTSAIFVLTKARDNAFDYYGDVIDRLVEPHKVPPRVHLPPLRGQFENCLSLLLIEARATGQPVKKWLEIEFQESPRLRRLNLRRQQ